MFLFLLHWAVDTAPTASRHGRGPCANAHTAGVRTGDDGSTVGVHAGGVRRKGVRRRHHRGTAMYQTIVVGTDCSPTAERAVAKAAELARLTGAKLFLVSAVSESMTAIAAASGASVADQYLGHAVQNQVVRVEATADRLR